MPLVQQSSPVRGSKVEFPRDYLQRAAVREHATGSHRVHTPNPYLLQPLINAPPPPVSTTLASPSRPLSSTPDLGPPGALRESNLHEALALASSVLDRYVHEGRSLNPTELAAAQALSKRLHGPGAPSIVLTAGVTASAPSQAPAPMVQVVGGCAAGVSPNSRKMESPRLKGLLSKMRRVVGASDLYTEMVASKESIAALTAFAAECAATMELARLCQVIRTQLAAVLVGVTHRVWFNADITAYDNDGRPLRCFVDPAEKTFEFLSPGHRFQAPLREALGRAEGVSPGSPLPGMRTAGRGILLEGKKALIPLVVDNADYGIVEVDLPTDPAANDRFLEEAHIAVLAGTAGIAALSLRTLTQFRRLQRQQQKNSAILEMAQRITAESGSTEAEIVTLIMENARGLVDAEQCFFFPVDEHQRIIEDIPENGPTPATSVLTPVPMGGTTVAAAAARLGKSINTARGDEARLGLSERPASAGSESDAQSLVLESATAKVRAAATAQRRIHSAGSQSAGGASSHHSQAFVGEGSASALALTTAEAAAVVEQMTGQRNAGAEAMLCVPVSFDGIMVGIAQLCNKQPKNFLGVEVPQAFSETDEQLFSTYGLFAALSIRNTRKTQRIVKEKRKSEAILEVVTYLSNCDIRDVNSVVSTVMKGAKQLLNADRSSLFMLDEERNELYAAVATDVDGKQIRLPIGSGIAGTVAQSGQAEIIADAYKDDRFNKDIDKQLGYRTLSILAEPITFSGDTLAVAQLVNKLDSTGSAQEFDETDQQTFRTFAMFAGISLSNSRLLEFAIRAGEEAMALHGAHDQQQSLGARRKSLGTIVTDLERNNVLVATVREDAGDVLDRNFNLYIAREGLVYAEGRDVGSKVLLEVFRASKFLETFECDESVLLNFICQCRRRYRQVPYHNFFHAVDTVQTVYTFLTRGGVGEFIHDLDCFVLLVAALCHDLDHMGVNNNFHLKTDSPLGILSSASGNKSVLEVHHCNIAIEILSDPSCNVFSGLKPEQQSYAYRMMIDSILATDMARHGDLMSAFSDTCGSGYDQDMQDHRALVMQMLLKSADISNVTKPFDLSRHWGMSVTEEFYQQGDKERERGQQVLPQFDRTRGMELAKGQIGFIDFVAERFFRLLVDELFDGMQWCVDNIVNNKARWQELLDGGSFTVRKTQGPITMGEGTSAAVNSPTP